MSSQKPAGAQIKRATHLRPLQSAVVDDKAITNVALLHYFYFYFLALFCVSLLLPLGLLLVILLVLPKAKRVTCGIEGGGAFETGQRYGQHVPRTNQ